MSIEEAVRNSILGIYLLTDDQSVLSNNDSFLQKGIIDSCDVLGLITFLEEEFGIHVEDEEVAPENLDSVNNVVRYVERKQQTRVGI